MSDRAWSAAEIPDQAGKVAIVTGASSGLGRETARVLAGRNAKTILAVRNVAKGKAVADEIRKAHPGAEVVVRELDLASLASVKSFAAGVIADEQRLDLLINNAGVMLTPYAKSEDGFELQLGTNHLGHFALVGHLMALLKATEDSRIVVLSSIAHAGGNIDFEDLNWERRAYRAGRAYGDSKIANLYFAYELARRLKGIAGAPRVMAAHPGWTNTELQRHSGILQLLNPVFAQDAGMGALPTLRAAFDETAKPGDYFGPSRWFGLCGPPVKVKSNRRSYDTKIAGRLWHVSQELTSGSY